MMTMKEGGCAGNYVKAKFLKPGGGCAGLEVGVAGAGMWLPHEYYNKSIFEQFAASAANTKAEIRLKLTCPAFLPRPLPTLTCPS